MLTEQEAIQQQKEMSSRVILYDNLPSKIKYIGGVDVGYSQSGTKAVAVLAIMNIEQMRIVEVIHVVDDVAFPYIPGLFSFREMPPVLKTLKKTRIDPDIIICDGHGVSHPRRFGLASHLGVSTDIPTVGCAKKRLTGEFEEPDKQRGSASALIDNQDTIGKVLRTQNNTKPLFVSVGHKVSLETACFWVLKLSSAYRLPEVIRAADQAGRAILKKL